jgi:hypothetical protein
MYSNFGFIVQGNKGHAWGGKLLESLLASLGARLPMANIAKFPPRVSLWLDHAVALIAVGEDSLPRRRFATPLQELSKHIIVI